MTICEELKLHNIIIIFYIIHYEKWCVPITEEESIGYERCNLPALVILSCTKIQWIQRNPPWYESDWSDKHRHHQTCTWMPLTWLQSSMTHANYKAFNVVIIKTEPLDPKRCLCHFWTNRVVGNIFFCNSCRIQCRKLNMIISICHGVTAILIKAQMWGRVYQSMFKHVFLHIAQNDISIHFGSRGSNMR